MDAHVRKKKSSTAKNNFEVGVAKQDSRATVRNCLSFLSNSKKKYQLLKQIRGRTEDEVKLIVSKISSLSKEMKKCYVSQPVNIHSISGDNIDKIVDELSSFVVVSPSPQGLFCRPRCPSRKKDAIIKEYPESIFSCIQRGLAPCGRCCPMDEKYRPPLVKLRYALNEMKSSGYKASLFKMAKAARLTKHHFDRSFKVFVGDPPCRYQRKLQMKVKKVNTDKRKSKYKVKESIDGSDCKEAAKRYNKREDADQRSNRKVDIKCEGDEKKKIDRVFKDDIDIKLEAIEDEIHNSFYNDNPNSESNFSTKIPAEISYRVSDIHYPLSEELFKIPKEMLSLSCSSSYGLSPKTQTTVTSDHSPINKELVQWQLMTPTSTNSIQSSESPSSELPRSFISGTNVGDFEYSAATENVIEPLTAPPSSAVAIKVEKYGQVTTFSEDYFGLFEGIESSELQVEYHRDDYDPSSPFNDNITFAL